jgi:hypothetical protein
MNGRDAVLQAFDRLFDAAAAKLDVSCTAEERAQARANFARRLEQVLEVTSRLDTPPFPEEVIAEMRSAIAGLSTAELAGIIAGLPLAQRTQEMLRAAFLRQAEQKVLEHYAMQADTRYGGN